MDTTPKASLKDIILVDDLSQQGSPHFSVCELFLQSFREETVLLQELREECRRQRGP